MDMKTDYILQVESISNDYEGEPLLRNIGFSMEQGEIISLLGPSGSGKTTLLRIIAGLEQDNEGSIMLHGQDITNIPPHQRNIGMMFQEYALFPHMTVFQNIAFGLEMQKQSPEQIRTTIESVLELVGLRDFAHRSVGDLSGGERQRVALARSLAPGPTLLLLDEPLGSLDRMLRERLSIEIRNILKELQLSAIFVTHDQSEAFCMADRVGVLHDGVLQQLSSPEQLYRAPENETVARFLGFGNFLFGQIDATGIFDCSETTLKIPVGKSQPVDTPATLLIRPEAVLETTSSGSDESGFTLSGQVKNRIFQGNRYRMTLVHDTVELQFNLPIDPAPPQSGQTITLVVKSSAIVVLNNKSIGE
ncbi:MAG: ABC transporter ATP-binding protein [Desulfobulbaceae bacterium]|nr:MAG: ABC transporter ATP-binding protein [Desulfobulbaceae bacterium]